DDEPELACEIVHEMKSAAFTQGTPPAATETENSEKRSKPTRRNGATEDNGVSKFRNIHEGGPPACGDRDRSTGPPALDKAAAPGHRTPFTPSLRCSVFV